MLPAILLKQALFCLAIIFVLSVAEGKRGHGVNLLAVRNRVMLRRRGIPREELKSKVCYDLVGCFADPPPHLSLKRPPQPPSVIKTKFLLYTRAQRNSPETLEYGDNYKSITKSLFNATKGLKVIIHGYKGSGSDLGAIAGAQALLDLEDTNVIMLDWTRGAGTTYSAAVANTELVGRQLALVLLDTINLGTDPKEIHAIGFSLGAHVAGCASEVLKKKNLLLGRITGLDPASPFFRHHLFREKSRKLDATDAQLVDVIHTDGSTDFADGFGLLKPIGHIDFFPNGGREQPGCNDVKNSVVVSHLKDDLDRNIACSHLRSWQLFVESIRSQKQECKFTGWPCNQGATSYAKGMCFPMESTEWSQEMGYAVNSGPLGIYYLATRGEEPFCGQPLRASVTTTEGALKTSGILFFKIFHDNSTTTFKIRCALPKRSNEWMVFYNIAAAKYGFSSDNSKVIEGKVWYQAIAETNDKEEDTTEEPVSNLLKFNKLTLEDRKGNRWELCSPQIAVNSEETYVELRNGRCAPT